MGVKHIKSVKYTGKESIGETTQRNGWISWFVFFPLNNKGQTSLSTDQTRIFSMIGLTVKFFIQKKVFSLFFHPTFQ